MSDSQPTLEQLLAAGVHFGHQTRRWNPKMRRFIFAERNGIHIIDLQQTLHQLELAQKLAREVVLRGENVLFVCTKTQLAGLVRQAAESCGAHFITERWLGGLLTNFQTVKKQLRRMKELEAGSESGGEFENYTKKEQLMMSRERDKLTKYLGGIKGMTRLPGLMFVVDSRKERIAVAEANKLKIPMIAVVDTNADPDLITVPIAGNDDAIRSVELIANAIAATISEARREVPVRDEAEEGESYTYSSDRGAEPADGEQDRKRRRRTRRRRAKPGAIAARIRTAGEGGDAGEDSGSGDAEASSSETGGEASSSEGVGTE
ncbi:MAG TPA: 30S ribosomal protein S2 [Gemmatimonadaceae bacterium]|jgi:small subunit ribosomal protein S2|nr:30S ribosomal protein S2 [Gemmatimonadaceae bacterium]